MTQLIFLILLFTAQFAFSKNDFPLNANSKSQNNYLSILQSAANKVKPLYDRQGWKLKVGSNWSSDTVNAYAYAPLRGTANLQFFGGLYRHENVDNDGFLLVFCHEVGHHLAGRPVSGSGLSVEGQADYFATHTCLPLMFADQDNSAWVRRNRVSLRVMQLCNRVWGFNTSRSYLCQRSLSASEGVALMFHGGGENKPTLWAKDHSHVETTNSRHPEAQCRLDTYVAGATCNTENDPGSNRGKICSFHQAIERKAIRPGCWFAD